MKLFLDREHTGTFVDAITNWTSEAANLSIFGVFAYGWPPKIPWESLKSLQLINNTFGFDLLLCE
jgi:hypothetical protein